MFKKLFVSAMATPAIAILGLCFGIAPSAFADVIDLGSAADYAVVGVGGSVSVQSDFEIYQSATVINGNVAQGPYTTLTHGIDATVNGRWDYDLTDSDPSASGYTGNVTGGFNQTDLSGVAADARSASAAAAAFAPTQTFTSLDAFDGVGSIDGNGGVNVIRITGDSSLKISLTLKGTASDTFIFQFTSSTTAGHDILNLSGMTMILEGGLLAQNIYWNFDGVGGDININAMAAGQTVYGTFLAPDRNFTGDHAIIEGRVIAGGSGSSLSIHSGSEINNPPPVPDGGSTVMLLGIALSGLAAVRRFLKA
jgi:choice-of-anchor A domain-containing protein